MLQNKAENLQAENEEAPECRMIVIPEQVKVLSCHFGFIVLAT